ncbi:MAG: 1-deoxy-D-xylulose-5-phosphate synthase [candidate division Zixibacteria bacterium]|nr:1-deoxy-D-xylulose-5-phosphate synthase [candidate division Zixibacteria bacterium]
MLNNVNSPADIKGFSIDELLVLAEDIRQEVISTVSKTGGHLASNLGVVELTIALHFLYDCPTDQMVWDVAHQAYVHKLLTGRRDRFDTIRQYGGISGFTKRTESDADPFGAGHASTSISSALGLAEANARLGLDKKVIAIIGDGSLTGGLSYEGLNNAGAQQQDLLVILNDNEMSISKNVGAISRYLTGMLTDQSYNKLRDDIWRYVGRLKRAEGIKATVRNFEKQFKGLLVPGVFFERLGFRYFGPIDGHDLPLLLKTLEPIKDLHGPRLLHVLTKKGKGYEPAEKDATKYHGVGSFNKITGQSKKSTGLPSYTAVFGKKMADLAKKNKELLAITAAMAPGTGLNEFADKYPDRFYDVGIAEGHAVCYAAGLAAGGARPVVAIYSTFLQRAYDQIIHDVALQKLPVVFCIDRAGLVGEDGPTHHGTFDISYLRPVPNITIASPSDGDELEWMLEYATENRIGPVAIRYPRGTIPYKIGRKRDQFEWGRWEVLSGGNDLAIIATGSMVNPCRKVVEKLREDGVDASLINGRFIKPLDKDALKEISDRFDKIVTVEENSINGGFGSAIFDYLDSIEFTGKVLRLGIPDTFIQHGSRSLLLKEVGLDDAGIYRRINNTIAKPKRSLLSVFHIGRNGKKHTSDVSESKTSETKEESSQEAVKNSNGGQ